MLTTGWVLDQTGVYTANTAGTYLAMANVRLDGADAGALVSVAIALNGVKDAGNGMTVTQGDIEGSSGVWNLMVAGIVSLAVGDSLNVAVLLPGDDDFYIQHETAFAAVSLQTDVAFGAALTAQQAGQAGQWQELTTFSTAAAGLFSVGSGFDSSTGRFTAPQAGIYLATASVRLSGVTDASAARFTIALNAQPDDSEATGLHTLGADAVGSSGDRHDVVAGVFQLSENDVVSVFVRADSAFAVEAETSFMVAAMGSDEGFEVQLSNDVAVTNQGNAFVELRRFRTAAPDAAGGSTGLFATTLAGLGFPTGLNLASGRYTAPFPGVYFTHASVRLSLADEGSYIRLVIALNEQTDDAANGGISAITGEVDSRVKDIAVTGLLSLDVGDFFSVWVRIEGEQTSAGFSDGDNEYTVQRQTRFAASFITSPDRTTIECIEPPNVDYNGDVCSTCIASGASCARCANVFGFDCSCACVADQCSELPNSDFGGDTCSDCLHSGASCEQCRTNFGFDCSCACNENDEWAFWRPDRCFQVECGAHGFCHEGSCICVDGYRGANCIVPPAKGMVCGEFQAQVGCDWRGAGFDAPPSVDLGDSVSETSCQTQCRTQAEAGTTTESGCCSWTQVGQTGVGACQYMPGVGAVAADATSSAAVCELTDRQQTLDDYSLARDDCTDIQPVTERLVEAVIKLHSQLQNRACVAGYFENEYGICERIDPVVEPVVTISPQSCTGRNPSRRGEPLECTFRGEITQIDGPTPEIAGMRFDSSDAMVMLHPFATESAGGVPLKGKRRGEAGEGVGNPDGRWTLDCWFLTPLPPHGQWHTLTRGAQGDSQVIVAPDQDSEWLTATYTADVGSLTTDPPVGEVTNWDEEGSKLVPGTEIPRLNTEPLTQDYYTRLVPGSRLSLGTYTGSGGDAGAGLPSKFSDTGFDVSTLPDGAPPLLLLSEKTKNENNKKTLCCPFCRLAPARRSVRRVDEHVLRRRDKRRQRRRVGHGHLHCRQPAAGQHGECAVGGEGLRAGLNGDGVAQTFGAIAGFALYDIAVDLPLLPNEGRGL